MKSQEALADDFVRGREFGRASNVQIMKMSGGWTALVGYGWAVYAVRVNSGDVIAYRDWYGHSPATSCQLTKMRISHPADTSVPDDDYDPRPDRWIRDVARVEDFQDANLAEVEPADVAGAVR